MNTFYDSANHPKPLVKHCFEATGKVDKTPYETCRLRRFLEPFMQNGTEKYQKSITFIRENEDVLRFCKSSKNR